MAMSFDLERAEACFEEACRRFPEAIGALVFLRGGAWAIRAQTDEELKRLQGVAVSLGLLDDADIYRGPPESNSVGRMKPRLVPK